MAEMEETSVPVVAVTAAVGAIVLLFIMLCSIFKKDDTKSDEKNETEQNGTTKIKKPSSGNTKKQKPTERNKKEGKHNFTHKWLAGTLKGHSSPVLDLDFSPNGKYLATCAENRTILLWSVKDFDQKGYKSIRVNVELDHATRVRFSPDNKALVMSIFNGNTIRVMRMGKKADGTLGNFQTAFDFPQNQGSEIVHIGIASSGKFIMTACGGKDTHLRVFDIKGELLAKVDSLLVNVYYAAVSPCGRFIGASGFTAGVKVWEVSFDKSGTFREVVKAFDLSGHTAGIYSFAFNSGSTRMATVSKDGTWKTWDTNIEYQKGQTPYLLTTGNFNNTGVHSLIALSPDGRSVAIATGPHISMFDAETTNLAQTFEDAHSGPVTAMCFDSQSRHLVSAGGKHVHIFHNVVGYRVTIRELTERKKKAQNQGQRDRLQQQIDDAQSALEAIQETSEE